MTIVGLQATDAQKNETEIGATGHLIVVMEVGGRQIAICIAIVNDLGTATMKDEAIGHAQQNIVIRTAKAAIARTRVKTAKISQQEIGGHPLQTLTSHGYRNLMIHFNKIFRKS